MVGDGVDDDADVEVGCLVGELVVKLLFVSVGVLEKLDEERRLYRIEG